MVAEEAQWFGPGGTRRDERDATTERPNEQTKLQTDTNQAQTHHMVRRGMARHGTARRREKRKLFSPKLCTVPNLT